MFSLFPNQWELPVPRNFKTIKNLADHHFPTKTLKISAPVQAPRTAPVKPVMPIEELCLGEVNDFREIDQMLAEMDNPTPEAKTRQILDMIAAINESLRKNISILKSSPGVEVDTVSKKDLLKLFEGFLNYSLNLENYFKSINQVKTI